MYRIATFLINLVRASLQNGRVIDCFRITEEFFVTSSNLQVCRVRDMITHTHQFEDAVFRQDENSVRDFSSRLDEFSSLPKDSVGYRYYQFVIENRLDPLKLPLVPLKCTGHPVTIFANRIRDTHDLWHVVTGYSTDIFGELCLQAFYLGQRVAPTTPVIHGLCYLVRHQPLADFFRSLRAIAEAFFAGRNAKKMAGIEWESIAHVSVNELRTRYGIRVEAQPT